MKRGSVFNGGIGIVEGIFNEGQINASGSLVAYAQISSYANASR